jgi:hypothetical protein
MARRRRRFEQGSALTFPAWSDASRLRAKRRRKRRRRVLIKIARTAVLLWLATAVIVGGAIACGLLLGPRGVEGLIATPFALVLTWAAILYGSLRSQVSPKVIAASDVAQLPARTEEWLEGQRRALPASAHEPLDAIGLLLEALAPQLERLDPQRPEALEVRRLLAEELPELVSGYQKVPRALQRQPLHGGESPDRQLVDGLATVEKAIGRIHERLAADDMRALATQQRYLEIKYKPDGELE